MKTSSRDVKYHDLVIIGYPTYDTTVAVTNDKVLDGLNEQIKSMITIPTGEGKMASCNVCGKQGPYKNMQRHIEEEKKTCLK